MTTTAGRSRRMAAAISVGVPATTVREPEIRAAASSFSRLRPTSTGTIPRSASCRAIPSPDLPVPPRIQTSLVMREVLFAGEDELVAVFAGFIGAAPPGLSAMATLEHALHAVAENVFEPRRGWMSRWREIVTGEPALQERGLSKQQLVAAAAVEALADRGVDAPVAELAAGIAFVVFQAAVADWITGESAARPLTGFLEVSFARMRQVVADDRSRG